MPVAFEELNDSEIGGSLPRRGPSKPISSRPSDSSSTQGIREPRSSGSRRGVSSVSKMRRSLLRTQPRKVLIGEMLLAGVIITASEIAGENRTPTFERYIAAFMVFAVLGFAEMLGDEAARLAMAFGGLFVLGLLLTPANDPRYRSLAAVIAKAGELSAPVRAAPPSRGGGHVSVPSPGTPILTRR